MYAKVLPDPVLAAPNTSRPFKRYGRDLDWMCVICVYPWWCKDFRVGYESSNSENFLSEKYQAGFSSLLFSGLSCSFKGTN